MYTKFYFPLLKLACLLLKIEVYKVGPSTQGRDPSLNIFPQKVHFALFLVLVSMEMYYYFRLRF